MAELKIDTAKVTDCAINIRLVTQNLQKSYNDIDKMVENLGSVYNTENTKEIQKKYYQLRGKIDSLTEALKFYSTFLEKTTKIYDDVEKKLQDYAASLAAQKMKETLDEWI